MRCAWLAVIPVLAASPDVFAQQQPMFTASMVHGEPAANRPVPAGRDAISADTIVRWFEQACIATQAKPGAAIDWALSNGFDPMDPMRGSTETLLGDQPGSVLVAPDSGGDVMLAASDAQCSLWVERQEGPPLRVALASKVGQLTAKGAKAQVQVERNLSQAGVWRSQVQWRYRAVGASRDLGIGAVTTLTNTPGTQVLNAAPLANAVRYSPEGIPVR